jgi:hypothetical protein
MKPFCETIVQAILPAIRAMVAKELMEKYKLTQQETAGRLGISQAAISQYRRDIRGFKVKFLQKDKDVLNQIENFSSRIAKDNLNFSELHEELCTLCKMIRKKRIICEAHMGLNTECSLCC